LCKEIETSIDRYLSSNQTHAALVVQEVFASLRDRAQEVIRSADGDEKRMKRAEKQADIVRGKITVAGFADFARSNPSNIVASSDGSTGAGRPA
jgi:aspartate aminotransferase-like enzyme